MITELKSEIKELTKAKVRAEAQIFTLKGEIERIGQERKLEIEQIQNDHRQELDSKAIEIQSLKGKLSELNEFANNKVDLERKFAQLEEDLKKEKETHENDVDDLERKRVEDIQNLNTKMLHTIKEEKEKAKAMNEEHIQTTTLFTHLENKRLTNELEYQSEQTEKLLKKNSKLLEQLSELKRDVEVHKQVESELAKRSHYCQKIIKKLNEKIKDMENQLSRKPKVQEPKVPSPENDSRMNEELVQFLENKLEETIQKNSQIQTEYNILKAEYTELKEKVSEKTEKFHTLGYLLSDYLKDLQSISASLIQDDEVTVNIHRAANTPVENLTNSDRANLVVVLLKQIQPYLSQSNLSIPSVSTVNVITSPLLGSDNSVRKVPTISIGVQTSFALGTFELPKLDVDPEIVKAPVRPWGEKFRSSRDSSLVRKARYKKPI